MLQAHHYAGDLDGGKHHLRGPWKWGTPAHIASGAITWIDHDHTSPLVAYYARTDHHTSFSPLQQTSDPYFDAPSLLGSVLQAGSGAASHIGGYRTSTAVNTASGWAWVDGTPAASNLNCGALKSGCGIWSVMQPECVSYMMYFRMLFAIVLLAPCLPSMIVK